MYFHEFFEDPCTLSTPLLLPKLLVLAKFVYFEQSGMDSLVLEPLNDNYQNIQQIHFEWNCRLSSSLL